MTILRAPLLAALLASAVFIGGVAQASPASQLVEAAKSQVGVTLHYDPAYTALRYPGGDVPMARGVCTDVVIRA
jgi:uncharacterized protein YijF (DUF1287 family)